MIAPNVPVIIVLALLTAAALWLVVIFGSMPGVTRRVTRSVWCPLREQSLTAELEEEVWDGKRVSISQCAAFVPPTAITCEKSCLRVTKRPSRRMRFAYR